MFIDSPQFIRRRVIYNADGIGSKSKSQHKLHARQPAPYQYGLEKSLLAKHVSQSLNSHQQDNEILERFRREAEEIKRRKYMEKRAKLDNDFQKQSPTKFLSKATQRVQQQPQLLVRPTYSMTENLHQLHEMQQNNNLVESKLLTKESNVLRNKYADIIEQKDRSIKKRDKKLEKNRRIIDSMAQKINQLQTERMNIIKQEELKIQKIYAMMEEMNYKIAVNRVVVKQELAKLKTENIHKLQPLNLRPIQNNHFQPPKTIVFKKSPYQRFDSEKHIHPPSIFYDIPRLSNQNPELQVQMTKNKLAQSIAKSKVNQKLLKTQFDQYQQNQF